MKNTIQADRTEKQVKIVSRAIIAAMVIGFLLYYGRTIVMYIQSHHI